MEKQQDKIRIKDIALAAGVSVGTVDRVIHGRSGVSQESRLKVQATLERMNYQPNMYASALAANKRYRLVCLLPAHSEGDYWEEVERGMKKATHTFSDFNVTLHTLYYDQYETESFPSDVLGLSKSKPDGVILSPKSESETVHLVASLENYKIPYVFIDSTIPSLSPLAFYGQHAHQSGFFAARMISLMANGHKELVIFRLVYEGRSGSNQQQEREKGFKEAMMLQHPEIQLLELDLFAKQPEENERLMNEFFAHHPNVSCGITFSSRAYLIAEYMQAHNRTDFHLLGYDLISRNITCLRSGFIDFVIAQQPFFQGYGSVESLCNYLILKKSVKQNHYMPLSLISVENLDFYLEANTNNE